jgi:ubiquinone biosynthesis protein
MTVVATRRIRSSGDPAGADDSEIRLLPAHDRTTYRGLLRRFLVVHRHLIGLLAGARVARADRLPSDGRHRPRALRLRASAALLRPFLLAELRRQPFPEQLRRRLELLGPTYVKLGQIMAIREDLLPAPVCRELQGLFDHVPPVPFEQIREVIEAELDAPIDSVFRWIDERPLGSASIAQVHRAETATGDAVVVKVMKPGIRRSIETDLRLLRSLGALLQRVIPRYQPRRIVDEFSAYTLREVDFTVEADNAETFAANFTDSPEVVFPRIHRELSTAAVLTMEYFEGIKPYAPAARTLSADHRKRLIDVGAGAIIRMLYRDGFFHADLHPANLLILPGDPPRIGFIDLGMAGRFEERTRRRMLYYYHALVTGDVEGAAKFLTDMAALGPGGDPAAFRRAVVDLSRRFVTGTERGEFSIAQLIVESTGLGGRYRVYFPVEMTLMVKALVTFEGVGRMLEPHLDVATLSRKHVSTILRSQFTVPALTRELLREAPELIELAVSLPQLLVDGTRFLEETFDRQPRRDPASGLRSSVLAGACLIGGVIGLTSGLSALVWAGLFAAAAALAVWGK